MNAPAYLKLYESGVLQKRIDQAIQGLEACTVCPWECGINRLEDQKKVCRTGRYAKVASYFPHFGEENCLRGWRGSGTIFFAWCNLRCVFCQNYDISQQEAGIEVTPERLADMMIELQDKGCHNINWVTPEHVVPQILESLPFAIEKGLRLPIVYNTSAFDSMESIQLMEGIVSIYMPDFKYWNVEKSKYYLKNPDYPATARRIIKEMYRLVGDLVLDEKGLAQKGLLIRHLVMPCSAEESRCIFEFIANEISPATLVNIMGQYYPAGKVNNKRYPEINRRLRTGELAQAIELAIKAGLTRICGDYKVD